ncbi:MAG: TonB-dependent receptor [Alphaproteobacteria bacterium]|nr:TonB-dependent receptor [Alphaproteobacteria bacterium]
MRTRLPFVAFFLLAALVARPAHSQDRPPRSGGDLTTLSLEDLMSVDVSVTSAARRSQRLNDVASAIYVLTADDIRRSGARSIPDALRLVPGMQVAQMDADKWGVSSRGFNGRFSNKLLVLMDGRTIYTPLFSGVIWELHQALPEDIERIEVIRGPGASLWGSNAVNGVINIITKSATATQGGLATAGAGTHDRGFGSLRWGGKLGDSTYYRASIEGSHRTALARYDEGSSPAGVNNGSFGLRLDSQEGANTYHLSAGHTAGSAGEVPNRFSLTTPFKTPFRNRVSVESTHVLGRWTHALSERSEIEVQSYASRERGDLHAVSTLATTFDMELQHRFAWGDRHNLVWGTGYRIRETQLAPREDIVFDPQTRTTGVFSAFIQDEIALVPKHLRLTVGSRIEHHHFTGVNVQPNARLSWTPNDRHSVWGSIARAVRTPSVGETDGRRVTADIRVDTGTGLPILFENRGTPMSRNEKITAFEAGYRVRVDPRLFADVATFYNIYDDLLGTTVGGSQLVVGPPMHILVPLGMRSINRGRAYGFELATEWQPFNNLRLRASYSLLRMSIESSDAAALREAPGKNPRHQAFAHASYDVSPTVKLDAVLRGVSPLTGYGAVQGYVTGDLRVAWQPVERVEISLAGTNLIGGERVEFVPDLLSVVPAKVGPTVYGKIAVRF